MKHINTTDSLFYAMYDSYDSHKGQAKPSETVSVNHKMTH